jgi:hypothetical protein
MHACIQCGNLLKLDMWGFVYKRELLLERKVQVLNTVITRKYKAFLGCQEISPYA